MGRDVGSTSCLSVLLVHFLVALLRLLVALLVLLRVLLVLAQVLLAALLRVLLVLLVAVLLVELLLLLHWRRHVSLELRREVRLEKWQQLKPRDKHLTSPLGVPSKSCRNHSSESHQTRRMHPKPRAHGNVWHTIILLTLSLYRQDETSPLLACHNPPIPVPHTIIRFCLYRCIFVGICLYLIFI